MPDSRALVKNFLRRIPARLSKSQSHDSPEIEGLRMVRNGGVYVCEFAPELRFGQEKS